MRKPTLALIESLVQKSNEYVETRLELFKLKLVDKTTQVASAIASGLVLFIIAFIVFVVFNIGLALLIGDLVGKSYWGFFILAAIYVLTGLVLYSSREKWVKAPITNMIIRKFLKKD